MMNQQVEIKPEEKINIQQNESTTTLEPKKEISNQEEKIESNNDINWRKFREQREIERKQKVEAERMAAEEKSKAEALKAAMEALLNKPVHNEYAQDETEEQRIEKKVQEAISKRESEYERQRQEREIAEFPVKLTQTYSDFNQVCSTENLDYLEYHYPELASPFKHMPDGFDKWSAIYKAVKRLVPNPDSKKDSKKADNNFQKPQSMSNPGTTQGGQSVPPRMLDDQRKAENWKRMQKALQGVS